MCRRGACPYFFQARLDANADLNPGKGVGGVAHVFLRERAQAQSSPVLALARCKPLSSCSPCPLHSGMWRVVRAHQRARVDFQGPSSPSRIIMFVFEGYYYTRDSPG